MPSLCLIFGLKFLHQVKGRFIWSLGSGLWNEFLRYDGFPSSLSHGDILQSPGLGFRLSSTLRDISSSMCINIFEPVKYLKIMVKGL